MGMGPKVFLSYSSEDKTIADRVCSALEAADIPCWIAPRDILPGVDYPTAIVEAISSVEVLVLILNRQAAASPHIRSEVGQAFNDKKRIIPFRLFNDRLPENLEYFLSMTQWRDDTDGCTDENIKRLTEAILDPLAGGERGAIQAHRRRTMMAVAFVLLALLASAMVYRLWSKSRTTLPNAPLDSSALRDAKPQPKIWLNPIDGQKYVWIAPGTFTMGCSPGDSECSNDEKPAHPVDIEKGFWLEQTEVTIGAYKKFADKHKLKLPAGDATLPVTGLTWAKAKEYCAAIRGRLPTEAEWECAARGRQTALFPWGDVMPAWIPNDGRGPLDGPWPVTIGEPTDFGLFGIGTNIHEWCADWYDTGYYNRSPERNPAGPETGVRRASRGGAWRHAYTMCRVTLRSKLDPSFRYNDYGFRVARGFEAGRPSGR